MKQRNAKFEIGQVFAIGCSRSVGVVFDVDPEYANTKNGGMRIPQEIRPRKGPPFYHLFAETMKRIRRLLFRNRTSLSMTATGRSGTPGGRSVRKRHAGHYKPEGHLSALERNEQKVRCGLAAASARRRAEMRRVAATSPAEAVRRRRLGVNRPRRLPVQRADDYCCWQPSAPLPASAGLCLLCISSCSSADLFKLGLLYRFACRNAGEVRAHLDGFGARWKLTEVKTTSLPFFSCAISASESGASATHLSGMQIA